MLGKATLSASTAKPFIAVAVYIEAFKSLSPEKLIEGSEVKEGLTFISFWTIGNITFVEPPAELSVTEILKVIQLSASFNRWYKVFAQNKSHNLGDPTPPPCLAIKFQLSFQGIPLISVLPFTETEESTKSLSIIGSGIKPGLAG